jgi:hypothetical protein
LRSGLLHPRGAGFDIAPRPYRGTQLRISVAFSFGLYAQG